MRRLSAISHSKEVPYGDPTGDLWGIDIESCAAEMLVGKYLNQFWHQSIHVDGHRNPADVGASVEVRHTARTDGRLIVHSRDKDSSKFVLVVGSYPSFRIVGWITGAEAKREAFWWEGARHPAYFVPQEALFSPALLRENDQI